VSKTVYLGTVNTDEPDALKQACFAGQDGIIEVMAAIFKQFKEENPQMPGLTWTMLALLVEELKKKKPNIVEAQSDS